MQFTNEETEAWFPLRGTGGLRLKGLGCLGRYLDTLSSRTLQRFNLRAKPESLRIKDSEAGQVILLS